MKRQIEIALFLVVVAVAVFLFYNWLGAHIDRIRLQAELNAGKRVIAAAEDREKQRAEELRQQLALNAAAKAKVQTPQQVVREIPKLISLPVPMTLEQKPGELPDKPGAHIAFEDLKTLYDFASDCRDCKLQLAAAQADRQDEKTKLETMTRERDEAVTAAKGGGFWARTKRAAKWFAIGALTGAVAVKILHR